MKLKNVDLDSFLSQNGYVVLNDFLSIEKCDLLKKHFSALNISSEKELYDTTKIVNKSDSFNIISKILNVCNIEINDTFSDYISDGASFMIKSKSAGECPLHIDWTIVDNSTFKAGILWVALENVNHKNGSLFFLDGTNNTINQICFNGINFERHTVIDNDVLQKSITHVSLKKGDAVFFLYNVFHGSMPNYSDSDRVAAIINIRSVDSILQYYQKNELGYVDQYNVDKDFYFEKMKEISDGKNILCNQIPNERIFFHPENIESTFLNNISSKKIVRSNKINHELSTKGFSIIDEFLDERLIDELVSFSTEYLNSTNCESEVLISFQEKKEKKQWATANTTNKLTNDLDKFFKDYKIIQSSLIIKKGNGANNEIPPHQDWSFVEEGMGESFFTLWIPLSEINENNGQIGFIEGSNNIPTGIRFLPEEYCEKTSSFNYVVNNFKKTFVRVGKGQAVIWNTKTIHFSKHNNTSNHRVALAIGLTHNTNKIILNLRNKKTKLIDVYEVEDDFFTNNNSKQIDDFYLRGSDSSELKLKRSNINPDFHMIHGNFQIQNEIFKGIMNTKVLEAKEIIDSNSKLEGLESVIFRTIQEQNQIDHSFVTNKKKNSFFRFLALKFNRTVILKIYQQWVLTDNKENFNKIFLFCKNNQECNLNSLILHSMIIKHYFNNDERTEELYQVLFSKVKEKFENLCFIELLLIFEICIYSEKEFPKYLYERIYNHFLIKNNFYQKNEELSHLFSKSFFDQLTAELILFFVKKNQPNSRNEQI